MGKSKKRPAQSSADSTGNNKNKAKKQKNNTKSVKPNKGNDWLDSLVQKSVVGNDTTILLSKEDRKRKREAKKAKRQQQKLLQQQQQTSLSSSKRSLSEESRNETDASQSRISKRRLQRISASLENVRRELYGDGGANNIKLYNASNAAKTNKRKLKTTKWSEGAIQPRPSDYSGIGLARQSLFIEFVDPSCIPKLEEEFREHIPGFFGKQRTKAMKRQTDGNMLWRQLQDKKSVMSKKLRNMNPDERVQAMIDSGMI